MYAVKADNQILVREAISAVLTNLFKFEVIQVDDAGAAVAATQKFNPVLVIMEMLMPGMHTFEAAAQIRRMAPYTKIVIMTGQEDVDLAIQARNLKIQGYILKSNSLEETKYALNTVLRGGIYVPPSLHEQMMDPERRTKSLLDTLTLKERAMLTLIAQGKTMKVAAVHMNISIKTAETHRNNLGRKLGNPNKAQIFAFAIKHRMVDAESLTIVA